MAPLGVDVAVLAGGLGTRLRSVLPDLPKVMAPVGTRPFLDYMLRWLIAQGAGRVVLGLGYRADSVMEYLSAHDFRPLEILTRVEPRPLGTAGALAFALPCLSSDPVMVINGDTFVDADLPAFVASHRNAEASVSVLCMQVADQRRYGRVEVDSSGRIVRFSEKSSGVDGAAWVSAGVYLLNRTILKKIEELGHGSLERDVFEVMPCGSIHAFRAEGSFLDIGTMESLAEASAFFERRSRNDKGL